MKLYLSTILSFLLLSSPLFGQSGKPQTIIIPTGSLGEMSESRIKILEKTLESKLDDYFAIVPKELFEEAQEQAFEELEYDECTEDQCIRMIQELLQIEKAFKMDPALTFEVATYKHRIAAHILTMADSLKDLNSLRFVVYALEETKRLTGGLSKTNGRILDELKLKLTERDVWITRQKIDEILRSEKEIQEAINPIELGMTISQVEDIMGSPSEMMAKGSEKKNQLWIYRYENGTKVYLTFTDYKLFRIEKE